MLAIKFSHDQRCDIEIALSSAMDNSVGRQPDTRQEFAWRALSHFIGGLAEIGAIDASYMSHLNTLLDTYDSIPLRREVK